MIDVHFEDRISPELLRIAAYIPNANEAGLKAVGRLGQSILRTRINRIYQRAIPRTRTGRPMWKRKGALRNSPQTPDVRNGQMSIGFGGRALPYVARRSGLGVTWMPRRPAGGLIRRNDFITDAQQILRTNAAAVYEEAFRRELRLK